MANEALIRKNAVSDGKATRDGKVIKIGFQDSLTGLIWVVAEDPRVALANLATLSTHDTKVPFR